jgi:hypothetical protein
MEVKHWGRDEERIVETSHPPCFPKVVEESIFYHAFGFSLIYLFLEDHLDSIYNSIGKRKGGGLARLEEAHTLFWLNTPKSPNLENIGVFCG